MIGGLHQRMGDGRYMDHGWKQFMITGKIEDYLKFKQETKDLIKHDEQLLNKKLENGRDSGAGYCNTDGYCSGKFSGRGI